MMLAWFACHYQYVGYDPEFAYLALPGWEIDTIVRINDTCKKLNLTSPFGHMPLREKDDDFADLVGICRRDCQPLVHTDGGD